MHFLLFEWNGLMQPDLETALLDYHCSFRRFSYCFQNDAEDDFFESRFLTHLQNHSYDAVISFNFFPLVSKVCQKANMPYISWCYDCPIRISVPETLQNSCNTVLLFDRKEADDYRQKGYDRVFHMPLAISPKRLNQQLQTPKPEYACDVSFLGNLHHGNFLDFVAPLSDFEKGYLSSLIHAQQSLSGIFLLDLIPAAELLKRYNPVYQAYTKDPDYCLSVDNFTYLFGKYVTEQERVQLLDEISRICDMHVYSNASDQIPDTCVYRGTADYFTVMPYIFQASKINLCPTFHCIRSGIPLRALDIMASGGFLLINAQEEMFESFAPLAEFAYYDSIHQAKDLVAYYLGHEDLRQRIALQGKLACQERFSYEQILPRIIKAAGLE